MTTRLYDILKSTYRQQLIEENPSIRPSLFLQNNKDDFLTETTFYTGRAAEVIHDTLFSGIKLSLSSDEVKTFEKDFITRFINRGIKFQTFDLFKLHLISEISVRKQVIEVLYGTTTRGKYLNEQTQTITQGESQSSGDTTSKSTSLPQTIIDFNSVDYADNLDNTTSNDTSSNSNTSTNVKMSFANLQSYNDMKLQLFTELDKTLFSQIF